MQLSAELIARFQLAHLKEFGESITVEVAERELLDLAELVRMTQKEG